MKSKFDILKNLSDDELIIHLYKKVWPNVLNFVRRNSGNSEDARDVFHDGIEKFILVKQRNQLDFSNQLEGYLFMICKNLWIEKSRRNKKVIFEESPKDMESNEDNMALMLLKEKANVVKSIIGNLGQNCKDLLEMTQYQGFTLEEAAVQLGYASSDAAKTTQYRCKKKMMELIDQNAILKELRQ